MFLPYGTDAPIYHWPKATVGLIVANVLIFFGTVGLPKEDKQALMLSEGHGLHPLEWCTAFFMHADAGHLIGNMIFLWAFGIVVEGKLGALKYLAVYLGMGVIHSATMQIVSLGAEGGYILGASAAIYGLLAGVRALRGEEDAGRAELVLAAPVSRGMVYAGAIALNLSRGRRELDCGCAGPADRRPIAWWMVWRNAILAPLLLLTTLEWSRRPFAAADALTLVGGLAAAVLLYATVDRLVGQVMPRTAALRRGL